MQPLLQFSLVPGLAYFPGEVELELVKQRRLNGTLFVKSKRVCKKISERIESGSSQIILNILKWLIDSSCQNPRAARHDDGAKTKSQVPDCSAQLNEQQLPR